MAGDRGGGVAAARPEGPTGLTLTVPEPGHRGQIAEILEETGLFRPGEIEVALEVFDGFCMAPGVDYWAIAALAPDRRLAGFAFYGEAPCTVGTWDLYWIAVRPASQGAGVGRGLLEHVEREIEAAGGRMCVIETSARQDYGTTRGFYEKCGYREVARVPDFYEDGDDRAIYVKRFGRETAHHGAGVSNRE